MSAAVLRLSALLGVRLSLPVLRLEALLLLAALFLTLTANLPFWQAVLAQTHSGLAFALFVFVTALNFLLLGLVATRRSVRLLLTILLPLSALSTYYIAHYGIVIDPAMVRNVLHTNLREARELLHASLFLALIPAALAVLLVWQVKIQPMPLRRAFGMRLGSLLLAVLLMTISMLSVFQDFSSLMRNHTTLRYLITPGNVIWSLGRVLVGDARAAAEVRDPPEPARLAAGALHKPVLLVVVVGETARAANFSLNGYARQTNPQLAQLDIINFPHATACGTSTEVSLPCMFSPFGRADYDEARIRRHESALHLAQRAGIAVNWLDNQSGCKGVCDAAMFTDVSHANIPTLCSGGHCQDEILLSGLKQHLQGALGDQLVVLHQLGNHGPAYASRYPAAFKRFTPVCENDDLGKCSREEIVNAYDNAITYTDHLLAQTIAYLKQQQDHYDVALLYVSDHGESLGEHGLFLHGMPYGIAPDEQTQVPMLWWLPTTSAQSLHVDTQCLRERAKAPVSHDNLFHSVLGLLSVETARYQKSRDLFAGCRTA